MSKTKNIIIISVGIIFIFVLASFLYSDKMNTKTIINLNNPILYQYAGTLSSQYEGSWVTASQGYIVPSLSTSILNKIFNTQY